MVAGTYFWERESRKKRGVEEEKNELKAKDEKCKRRLGQELEEGWQ